MAYTKPTNQKAKHLSVSTPNEYTDKATGELKTSWSRIGAAFEGAKGITVVLNALPVNGKLFISEYQEQVAK